jgi:eukaryotic-like serine/threonine-protein kinase
MQPGQSFGPFTLEKKIGAGAMGVIWRATYTKTGQRVAIKIMLPGLTEDNPNAAARFEREGEILRQLNHPNIVRLFGIGKFQGNRYYAMEYIDGESLDHLMARRERMSWEEVVALGKQLCSALQSAHERGVVHRDLKPSNLMILKDGTLKLTDFGIAKDLDVTQLTEANCTVGTASYMSPEQCRGEAKLTHKSDLYSLGIVFYELLTGEKPFKAESAMEMFILHVKGKAVRPGKRVLDLPVWMDTLVCQLMEKKPEHRPMDAAMVANVLNTIEEKVQTLQSAGVEVATRKRSERPRNAPERTEEDREIARSLGGKGKRKLPAAPRFYERWWFVAAGVLLLLGIFASVLFVALWLWPRSSVDKIYAQARPLMEQSSNPDEDWAKALEGPLSQFEHYHANDQGDKAEQLRQWARQARKRESEKMVRRYLHNKKKNLPYEAHGEVQENAFAAGQNEEDGDLPAAWQHWTRVKDLSGVDGWNTLAEERLQLLTAVSELEKRLEKHAEDLKDRFYKPSLRDQERELALALRYQRFEDEFRAFQEFEELRRKYRQDPDLSLPDVWYLFAAKKAKELVRKPGETDNIIARRERIANRVDEADKLRMEQRIVEARTLYLDVVDLYGNDKDNDIVKSLDRANKGLQEIKGKLKD